MSEVTVLIIGCGIAGPVLAILLQRKGYRPIVFEKVSRLGDVGGLLMLMPNGLKVLDLIGMAEELETGAQPLEGFLDCDSDGRRLGYSGLPKTFQSTYGHPSMGVKRTDLNFKLKHKLEGTGIDVREGWELEDIEESEDSVVAHFKGRRSITGSFLVGCDGIKAASRRILLRNRGLSEGTPLFSGLTQTAGFSRTPERLQEQHCLRNWFGEGVHIVAYPVSTDITGWALTLPETSGSEAAWGLFTPEEMDRRKATLLDHLGSWSVEPVKDLIRTASRILKFGLYDRDEMSPDQWYSRRCVLVGDAAHPTSPHLGQGANQALEDCFHLSHLLPDLIPESDAYQHSLAQLQEPLTEVFHKFAETRQPRTSELVKGARAQGQTRVVTTGPEDCRRRNEKIAAGWEDVDAVAAKFDYLLREPFAVPHQPA